MSGLFVAPVSALRTLKKASLYCLDIFAEDYCLTSTHRLAFVVRLWQTAPEPRWQTALESGGL